MTTANVLDDLTVLEDYVEAFNEEYGGTYYVRCDVDRGAGNYRMLERVCHDTGIVVCEGDEGDLKNYLRSLLE